MNCGQLSAVIDGLLRRAGYFTVCENCILRKIWQEKLVAWISNECAAPTRKCNIWNGVPASSVFFLIMVLKFVTDPVWSDADEKVGTTVDDAENGVTRTISRRDMATQMSPNSSICSSPKTRTSLHRSPPQAKLEEIRDVLMDRRSNVINWSKRHAARFKRKDRAGPKDSHDELTTGIRASSSWDIRETAKNTSRCALFTL